MVQGVETLRMRFARIPQLIVDEVVQQIEREAERIVQQMRAIAPKPVAGTNEIEIGWTWGDAPRGSITIGKVAGREYDKIAVRIYARGPQGSGWAAVWFEFGTKDRFHKSGKWTGRMPITPFFFPTYRANRSSAKSNISRAVRRGLKKT